MKKIIKRSVLDCFGIKAEDFYKKTRKREIVYARHAYSWYLRRFTKLTLQSIGKEIDKDHATIMHSVAKIQEIIAYNDFAQKFCNAAFMIKERLPTKKLYYKSKLEALSKCIQMPILERGQYIKAFDGDVNDKGKRTQQSIYNEKFLYKQGFKRSSFFQSCTKNPLEMVVFTKRIKEDTAIEVTLAYKPNGRKMLPVETICELRIGPEYTKLYITKVQEVMNLFRYISGKV